MNYYFIKSQLNKSPIVPMQQESFDNILDKVYEYYDERNINMIRVKDEFFVDTKEMYYESMHKSILQNTIITPPVKGLENEKFGSPPKELELV